MNIRINLRICQYLCLFLAMGFLLGVFFSSCSLRNQDVPISVPATAPLSRDTIGYAVVRDSYAQSLDSPGKTGVSLGFIRQGTVLPVLERRSIPDGEQTQWWLKVKATEDGWVAEANLLMYDTEAQALTASKEIIP